VSRCFKHKKRRAIFKWRICSDGPWRGVCRECDIELNTIALKWAYPKSWPKKLKTYIERTQEP
jgi:hypothetical protein